MLRLSKIRALGFSLSSCRPVSMKTQRLRSRSPRSNPPLEISSLITLDPDYLQRLNHEDHNLQKRYGQFGKQIPFRLFHSPSGLHEFKVDMRFANIDTSGSKPLEVQQLLQAFTDHPSIRFLRMTGVSGSGKSTTLIGVAKEHYSIMIETACSMNYLKDAQLSTDEQFKGLVADISAVTYAIAIDQGDTASYQKVNEMQQMEADRLLAADLTSRLLLLDKYLDFDGATPTGFLMLQLNGGNRMIMNAYKKLLRSSVSLHDMRIIASDLDKSIGDKIVKHNSATIAGGGYNIMLDEANQSMKIFSGSDINSTFKFYNTEGASTSLLYGYTRAIFDCRLDSNYRVIVAGTNLPDDPTQMLPPMVAKENPPLADMPVMPYLHLSDVKQRLQTLVNDADIEWDDTELEESLQQLTGRSRLVASIIQTELPKLLRDKSVMGEKTDILKRAADNAFSTALSNFHLRSQLAGQESLVHLVKMAYAYLRLTGRSSARHQDTLLPLFLPESSVQSLIALNLGSRLPGSIGGREMFTFHEPLSKAVILSYGQQNNWNVEEIVMNSFHSNPFCSGDANGFEFLCAATLANYSGWSVAQFVEVLCGESTMHRMKSDGAFTTASEPLVAWAAEVSLKIDSITPVRPTGDSLASDIAMRASIVKDGVTRSGVLNNLMRMPAGSRIDLSLFCTRVMVSISCKSQATKLSGDSRLADITSTKVESLAMLKPGSASKLSGEGAESAAESSVVRKKLKESYLNDIVPQLKAQFRQVRLHVAPAGYADFRNGVAVPQVWYDDADDSLVIRVDNVNMAKFFTSQAVVDKLRQGLR